MSIIKRFLSKIFIRIAFKKKNKGLDKKALLSFIVHPLYISRDNHPNQLELNSIIRVLSDLGYTVTVVDYRRKKVFGCYDLAIGFGDCYEYALNENIAKKYILYSTGSPAFIQNQMAIESLFRARKSCLLAGRYEENFTNSIRLTEDIWPNQLINSNGIITIGNSYTKSLFQRFHDRVHSVHGMCFDLKLSDNQYLNRELLEPRSLVWFGGKGCLHKGLDLCIESVLKTDWKLYIVGPLDDEIFLFEDYIRNYPDNIVYLGFMSVHSDEFIDLMNKVPFSILPSCSEGMATSIITLAYNFGTIPIVTKQCGIDLDEHIIEITSLSVEATQLAILQASNFSVDSILCRRKALKAKFQETSKHSCFVKDFYQAIKLIEGDS
ncbi:hypothetical protein BCU69_19190 [Vibrio cyclitrophicus]|uniref:hypothetical protein n=1 Tax=Vibrio cyclitrophicus TaxID=47951 RepID=UPI000C83A0FC|nr:hypothetical protein [Vibrio cyclitrophicus]PMH39150.1 hypothetical protein BCU69_19190 [Vibrio cyclitrophicus]